MNAAMHSLRSITGCGSKFREGCSHIALLYYLHDKNLGWVRGIGRSCI